MLNSQTSLSSSDSPSNIFFVFADPLIQQRAILVF